MGMDVVILSRISGIGEAGIYGAAFKLYAFWFFLPQCLAGAVFPQFAYSFQNDRVYFDLISEKALRFVLVIILPVVGGTIVLADRIILLIFGSEFQAAAGVLRILVIGLVPYASSVMFARRFIATKNQMADLRTNVVALVVVAIFLFILTPRFGARGAAISVCIATFVFLLQQLSYMKALHLKMRVIKLFLAPTVCASIMAGCTWLLRNQSLAIVIGLSAIIYFGSSIICGSIHLRWFDMILNRQFRLDRYK
jgi:O-antigen/teichoic acid export membrane protein